MTYFHVAMGIIAVLAGIGAYFGICAYKLALACWKMHGHNLKLWEAHQEEHGLKIGPPGPRVPVPVEKPRTRFNLNDVLKNMAERSLECRCDMCRAARLKPH